MLEKIKTNNKYLKFVCVKSKNNYFAKAIFESPVMIRKISFVLTMFLATNSLVAGGVSENKGGLYNPVPDIMHHISDSYEWHITGKGKHQLQSPYH